MLDERAMLHDVPVHAPDPIAVDLDGSASGEPSLLMTRLPGRVDFVRNDEGYLADLARLLVELHRFRPPGEQWPRVFEFWAFESKFQVPTWSREDGVVTGLVDWVETSSGPADIDVAHCVSNLAGLHGVECAWGFRQAYVDAGGELEPDEDASRYWQLMDLVAFLPDLTLHMARSRREYLLRVIHAGLIAGTTCR